jgi:hemoglobin/transferrin/lactoferrin receptor protein
MKISTLKFGVICFCLLLVKNSYSQLDTIPHQLQLNEIVISYNKTEERNNKVPQPIEIIDAKTIARSQAQTAADLIAQNGSVLVQKSQQGGGSPVIRGFEASRILLVIDGVRMNNLIYRSGHLQNIMTIDNIGLERAEIMFGPSSVQYGTDALGGAIHLFTKKPILSLDENPLTQVKIQSRYSTVNNESTTGLDINLGWKRFGSRTIFSYSRFGDLRSGRNTNPFYDGEYIDRPYYIDSNFDKPGSFGIDSILTNKNPDLQVKSGYNQYNVLQKFLFKQNDRISHGLNFQFSSSTNVPRYDRLTDVSGGKLKFSEWYYGPQERIMLSYDLNITRNTGFFNGFSLNASQQMVTESRHQRRYQQPGLQNRIEDVNVSSISAFAQHKSTMHELQIGADAQFNTLQSSAQEINIYTGAISALDTRYPNGTNSMNLAGIYVSHIWKINEKTNITDGVRLGYSMLASTLLDSTFFSLPFNTIEQKTPTYCGSLGLVHNHSSNLKISFLVSSAFRVPNIDDLAKIFESAPGKIIIPNKNIQPEKTISYEASVSAVLGEFARFDNSIYYTSFIDAIQVAPFTYQGLDSIVYDGTNSGIMSSQNLGNGYIYGFYTNLKTAPIANVSLLASANYTYGRIKTEQNTVPLDHISPFMAKLSFLYEKSSFFAEAYALYNGKKKLEDYSDSGEDNLNYATPQGMPAWLTLNMRIGYSLKSQLTVQGGVENILDTKYRVFASGINSPGRNLYLSLKYQF